MENKNEKNKLSFFRRKSFALLLCVLFIVISISPVGVSLINANASSISGEFNETLSQDKANSLITLQIDENDKDVVSIIFPNETKIVKENFTLNDKGKPVFTYTANKNATYDFIVQYKDKLIEETQMDAQEIINANKAIVQEKVLSYTVSDIVSLKEAQLNIVASELIASANSRVNFKEGIVVKDEYDNDITQQTKIEVINYGGYAENKTGEFLITYVVTYQSQVKQFTRNLTVLGLRNTFTSDVKLKTVDANTGSISLSSMNSTLTSPEQFSLGDDSQVNFNIEIDYSPLNSDTGRKIEVVIPEGFLISKLPTKDDFHAVDSITQRGNIIEVTFPNDISINCHFSIGIKQDEKKLFVMGSEGAFTSLFQLQGMSNENTNTVQTSFAITQAQLQEDNTIANTAGLKLKQTSFTITDYRDVVTFELLLEKSKNTRISKDLEVKIPKNFISKSNYGNPTYVYANLIIENEWKDYLTINNFNNDYIVINLNEAGLLKYAKADSLSMKVEFKYFQYLLRSNMVYESDLNVSLKSASKVEDLGKFVLDTRSTESVTVDMERTGSTQLTAPGINVELASFPYIKITTPQDYRINELTFLYTFPYELGFEYVFGSQDSIYITNTGRRINSVGYDSSQLLEGEWIKQLEVKETSDSVLITDKKGSLYFYRKARDTDEFGNAYANKKVVKVTCDVSSSDSNVVAKQLEVEQITLNLRNSDSLSIYVTMNSEPYYTNQDASLGSIRFLARDANVQLYKNVEMEIKGNEMLSIVDKFSMNYTSAENVSLLYSTNKRSNLTADQNSNFSAGYHFVLDDDEYLTSLKVYMDVLEVRYYNGSYQGGVYLESSKLPKYSKLNNIALKDGIQFDYSFTFKSSNAPLKTALGKSNSLSWRDEKDFISASNFENNQLRFDANENWKLGSIDFVAKSAYGKYDALVLTVENPQFLSMIDGFATTLSSSSGTYLNPLDGMSYTFTTNQGRSVKEKIYCSSATKYFKFQKNDDEFLTSLQFEMPVMDLSSYSTNQKINGFGIELISNIKSNIPYDGSYLGEDGTNLQYNVNIKGDDYNLEANKKGISPKLVGLKEVNIGVDSSVVSANGISDERIFQGNQIDYSMNVALNGIRKGYSDDTKVYGATLKEIDFELINPIFYFEVDNCISYAQGSIRTEDGFIPKISYLNKKTISGRSVIKIDMYGYSKLMQAGNSNLKLNFSGTIKVGTLPMKNLYSLYSGWVDLNESSGKNDKMHTNIEVSDLVNDDNQVQDTSNNKLVRLKVDGKNNEILSLNEMGVLSVGNMSGMEGLHNVDYDNASISQKLGVVSNHQYATTDWQLYIPVPKQGKSVYYQKSENGSVVVVKSEASQYSMKLQSRVDLSSLPINTKVSYSMDETPIYALDGSNVGNYSDTISDDDLHNVSMIKIEIPKIEKRESFYPEIAYELESDKSKVGIQSAFGGAYFNMKLEGSTDYVYGTNGTYSKLLTYDLQDYAITGNVWEEVAAPSNHVYDADDLAKSDVEIYAVDKNNNIFDTKTGSDGNYELLVPTSGKTIVNVKLPNNENTSPKQEYKLVESGRGNIKTSSQFDPTTAQKEVTLNNGNIHDINAGIWPIRSIAVNPDNVIVPVGGRVNVPAIAFPNYAPITYQESMDTDIANVSSDGVVTGKKVGTTSASVSILDGNGGLGIKTKTYTIQVVANELPTMQSTPIVIFKNGQYNAKQGVTILDGNKNPISIEDKSKVSINTTSVNTSKVGKYPIYYTITDTTQSVTLTRFIYVHGNVEMHVPNSIVRKVGTKVNVLNDASAWYMHVNEDGTIIKKQVVITTPNAIVTSSQAKQVLVPLQAEVTIGSLSDMKMGSYNVLFNENVMLSVKKDMFTIAKGSSIQSIINTIQAQASMNCATGVIDLSDAIDYRFLKAFDTSKEGNYIKGKIFVVDPDTQEKVEKEITIQVEKRVPIPINPIRPQPNRPDHSNNTNQSESTNLKKDSNKEENKGAELKKETLVAISREIPLSVAKKGITNTLVKSFISVLDENNKPVNFELVSHTIISKVGQYDAIVRLEDGSELSVKMKVVNDDKINNNVKKESKEKCIWHWVIFVLFAAYNIYGIVAVRGQRKEYQQKIKQVNKDGGVQS